MNKPDNGNNPIHRAAAEITSINPEGFFVKRDGVLTSELTDLGMEWLAHHPESFDDVSHRDDGTEPGDPIFAKVA